MYRTLLRAAVAGWLVCSFLLLPGCAMLLLGGAGGYLIRKGEEGGGGGDARSKTSSQSSRVAEQKTSAY